MKRTKSYMIAMLSATTLLCTGISGCDYVPGMYSIQTKQEGMVQTGEEADARDGIGEEDTEEMVDIVNSYDNTVELLVKYPVINQTPVDTELGKSIENRLLTGFENWNRGYDAWKAWGDILYTPNSIYNVHGARMTLREYQDTMDVLLKQTDIRMGDFHNMLITDDWTAIYYDTENIDPSTGESSPARVMEFVQFKDYGEELGTRVVEGWGGHKDQSYESMIMFLGEEERAKLQEYYDGIVDYELPETEDLNEKYQILYPTGFASEYGETIKAAILQDFEKWNEGIDAWAEWVDTYYDEGAVCNVNDEDISLKEYKDYLRNEAETVQKTRIYFDNMLIRDNWAAIHYRTVDTNLETGEKTDGDHMQFLEYEISGDDVKVIGSWEQ